jgi:polyphenol oxidase
MQLSSGITERAMQVPQLQPNWPVAPHVRSACSLRTGGVSVAPFDWLNLGDHVGDEPQAVARNREIYAQALQAKPVYLKQVHGFDVVTLNASTVDGTMADACITTEKNLACTIMVADCLPVLFCNRAGTVVGAAHAGWRGLCGVGGVGVLEQIFKRFGQIAGKNTARDATELIVDDVLVWLGPCIGPTVFEVGAEVREAFLAADLQVAICFKPHGEKYLADIPALARHRLAKMGITQIYGNDGSLEWCTVSNPSKFFSHRRDKLSGRFAASVWLA